MFNETFWVGTAIVIFFALAYRFVSPLLIKALDARREGIRHDLEEALRLKEEAQALLAAYQLKQKEASDEAQRILKHAEEEARRLKKETEESLEETLNRRIELAMQKIAGYEASVLQEVQANAIDIALSAVRSLLEEQLGKGSAEALIQSALKDAEKKLH